MSLKKTAKQLSETEKSTDPFRRKVKHKALSHIKILKQIT